MTTQALAINDMAITQFDQMLRMGAELIKSQFLPKAISTPAQAVAVMLTGRELGIGYMTALQSINIIQGKPTIAPSLMLALAYQKIPGFDMTVLKSTDEACEIVFTRNGNKKPPVIFTIQDAVKLKLHEKDNWIKQRATMIRWRCVNAGLRLYAIDATLGLYSPEEMDPDLKIDFDTGAIVDSPPPVQMAPAIQIQQYTLPPEVPPLEAYEDVPDTTKIVKEVFPGAEVVKPKPAAKKAPLPTGKNTPYYVIKDGMIKVYNTYFLKDDFQHCKTASFKYRGDTKTWEISSDSESALAFLKELGVRYHD